MKKVIFTCFLIFLGELLPAQINTTPLKKMQAQRTRAIMQIDGILDEADWQTALEATGFIQNDPVPSGEPSQKTSVKIVYDNRAIYIGALLYDDRPNGILQELTERDILGNTDWFGVLIDAYQDGINAVGFYVTPAGVQLDTKYSAVGNGNGGNNVIQSGDENWDAVWDSEARITSDGWVVEMEIPYSALRFPNVEQQEWNINFGRMIRRDRELLFWNEVNPQVEGFVQQAGSVSGISNIKAPVRLSATPFVAAYLENFYDQTASPKSSWGRSFSGGMDIKYGINDAFTLDMTLIPDFGEALSDNQVLNLSPFEVRFDENRQFFTEGTELFNKGNLFYSRRIGGRPLHYWDVEDGEGLEADEELIANPSETQLYNATKISGRTNKGLGIGFFNAVAGKAEARVRNEEGEDRMIQTSPLTNYNIIVLDQNLKNNSYVSLINTNVLRDGEDYDANVTGVQFELKNEPNTYGLFGSGKLSQKYFTDDTDLGHAYALGFGKTSGKFTWNASYNVESHNYDPNDLGFLSSPNEKELEFRSRYSVYKSFGKYFNAGGINFRTTYSRLHKPDKYTEYGINVSGWLRTNSYQNFGMWIYTEPFSTFNYFEPRTDDFSRYYKQPPLWNMGGWISTDYRKKMALDVNFRYGFILPQRERFFWAVRVAPRFRFNNKFSLRWSTNIQYNNLQEGYVDTSDSAIIFGKRHRWTVENVLNANYTFNNKMSLSFRLRHYWSVAKYQSLNDLLDDGTLDPYSAYDFFEDNSFNALTIDAVYRWRFAPGSDMFVIWKNGIFGSGDEPETLVYHYKNSVNNLLDTPQSNSLSIKIIYYLDYLSLIKKK